MVKNVVQTNHMYELLRNQSQLHDQGTAIEKSTESPPNWAWQIQGPHGGVTPASLFSAAAASSGFGNSTNAASSSSSAAHHQPPFLASAIPHHSSVRSTSDTPPYFFRS